MLACFPPNGWDLCFGVFFACAVQTEVEMQIWTQRKSDFRALHAPQEPEFVFDCRPEQASQSRREGPIIPAAYHNNTDDCIYSDSYVGRRVMSADGGRETSGGIFFPKQGNPECYESLT